MTKVSQWSSGCILLVCRICSQFQKQPECLARSIRALTDILRRGRCSGGGQAGSLWEGVPGPWVPTPPFPLS